MENIKFENLNKTPVRTLNSLKLNDITIENFSKPQIKEFSNVKVLNENISGITLSDLVKNKEETITESLNAKTLEYFEYGVDKELVREALENYNQGYVIEIEENQNIYNPLFIDYILDDNNLSLVDNVTVIANENSSATIYLKYSSENKNLGYHNGILSVIAKQNSNIKIVILNFLGNVNHFYSIDESVKEGANVDITVIDLGGNYSISNFYSDLEEKNANSSLSTIYLGVSNQVIDMNYLMRLRGEKTKAEINVQGALKDVAHKNFKGTIDFRKGAIKSKGLENEYCMLLSKEARSKALPIMLCEEDYVEGNHSTACGKIDEDKLFYIMTRGISYDNAKKIIVKAKFSEIIEKISDDNVREEILSEIDRRLENDR